MKKVLVIEDDPIAELLYGRFLRAHGFESEVARDGAFGLVRINEFKPDAVFLDLMMPKVNGLEVLENIRAQEHLRTLPVFVLTAAAMPSLVELAIQAGADRIFDKANDKLLAMIAALQDLLQTNCDPKLTLLAKSGNPEAFLDF